MTSSFNLIIFIQSERLGGKIILQEIHQILCLFCYKPVFLLNAAGR